MRRISLALAWATASWAAQAHGATVAWTETRTNSFLRSTVIYHGSPNHPHPPGWSEENPETSDSRSVDLGPFGLTATTSRSRWGASGGSSAAVSRALLPDGRGTVAIRQSSYASGVTVNDPSEQYPNSLYYVSGFADTSFGVTVNLDFVVDEQVVLRLATAKAVGAKDDEAFPSNAQGTILYSSAFTRLLDPSEASVSANLNGNFIPETGISLGPGEFTLQLIVPGTYAASTQGLRSTSSHYAISWTMSSTFPGETPDHPIVSAISTNDGGAGGGGGGGLGCEPAGPLLSFAFPAAGDLGVDADAFLALPAQLDGDGFTGVLVTGYEVVSESSPLMSFTVPELPASAAGLSIDFGGGPQSVVAGQTIDFGPAGVQSFTLAGFDPAQASASSPLVMGIQVAEEGLASVLSTPAIYSPLGDFDKNGVIDGADVMCWQIQLGDTVDPAGTGADGFPDGLIDALDLEVWKLHLGAPALAAATHVVAEPTTAALTFLVGGAVHQRIARRKAKA